MHGPIRILYVNGGLMNRGGIESYMMNYYRHFDRSKVQIDFVVHDAGGYGYYDDEIKQLGGHIYVLPQKSKSPFVYARKLKQILQNGDYKIIHTHMDAMGAWVLKTAKDCGIPIRIAHSHNTQHLTNNKIKLFFLEHARKSINKYATHRMACSEVAGQWLFGDAEFEIVRNAIDVERFAYNEQMRKKIRKEWGIKENEFLIGHVGRFDTQKNHIFLANVFNELKNDFVNVKMMLIGEGHLQKSVKQIVKNDSRVIFTGAREDVFNFYNAFDLFVLPSLFEGLGIVSIEAQVNGCPNLLSSKIPNETDISGNVKFIPLQRNTWKDKISEFIQNRLPRCSAAFDIYKSGYSIEIEAQKLQNIYIDLWNRH